MSNNKPMLGAVKCIGKDNQGRRIIIPTAFKRYADSEKKEKSSLSHYALCRNRCKEYAIQVHEVWKAAYLRMINSKRAALGFPPLKEIQLGTIPTGI